MAANRAELKFIPAAAGSASMPTSVGPAAALFDHLEAMAEATPARPAQNDN